MGRSAFKLQIVTFVQLTLPVPCVSPAVALDALLCWQQHTSLFIKYGRDIKVPNR